MSKKTWTTVLIVVLVIAAVVAIYFLTRQPAPVAPTPTPTAEATLVPDSVTEAPEAADITEEAPAEQTTAPASP